MRFTVSWFGLLTSAHLSAARKMSTSTAPKLSESKRDSRETCVQIPIIRQSKGKVNSKLKYRQISFESSVDIQSYLKMLFIYFRKIYDKSLVNDCRPL